MQLSMQLFSRHEYRCIYGFCRGVWLLNKGFRKICIDLACDLLLFLRHCVLIYSVQHIFCFMPHHFHGVLIGDIICQHDRCVIMAERVEGAVIDLRLFPHCFKII